MNHLKKLGGESLLYALMNVGTKLIAFFMLPIYTLYLTAAEMGVFENIEALVSILTFIVIFGTDNALAYYFFNTDEEKDKESFVKVVLNFRILISAILFILFLIFGQSISYLILGTKVYYNLFLLAGFVILLDAVVTLILTYYRFQFKAKKVAILTVSQLLMVAIITYIFLKYSNLMVGSIYLSRIISAALIILVLIIPIIRFLSFKIDKSKLILVLKYGAPLVPASIAFWVITFANRFFLTHFESLESAGIYGIAIKFAAMISLLTSSVQMAWRPYSLSIQKLDNAAEIYSKISIVILGIGMVGLTGVATVAPLLVDLMVAQDSYQEASRYVAILSMGSFLSFYYLIISVGLFLKNKTKVLSKYVILSSIISVILNIILVPFMSIWGAAIALVLSYLFVNIIIFKKSQEVYPIPFPFKSAILLFVIGLTSMMWITYIYEANLNYFLIIIPWLLLIGTLVAIVRPQKMFLRQR